MTTITENAIPSPRRTVKDEMVAFAIMTALLLVVPLTGVYPFFVMQALCFALLACAFNLLIGYGGLLSFGHAMFLGTAGYCTAHALKVWGLTPELGIVVGVAAAAALSVVTGLIAIRRQGIYFAMITLAFAQMIYFICIQAPFTGGEDGLQGIVRKPLLGGLIPTKDDRVLYYVVLAIFLFGYGMIYRIIHSPFGQVLKAIRDNEQRAVSLGYEADRYKLLAFVLSAALAGLAGATKAMVLQFATLTDVSAATSGEVVLMALVGGLGTIIGPVVGAFIIITMQNYLAATGEFVLVIQGVIFVVIVMAFRKGVVGEFSEWWKRRSEPRAQPKAAD
jgi:branched-chain amino acid transport system permease protein